MVLKYIKNVFVWIAGTALTILLYVSMLILSIVLPFDKKRKIVHAQCFWWSDAVLGLNPFWKVEVSGLENIDKTRTYVVVANHQSLADIVVMYQTRMQFKWVAKESLFKVPFIGWSLALAKHIKLSRGNFSSIKTVYREASAWLRNGMSVLFFPEGTRSEGENMKEFQNGAFKLAIKEKVPVLPIYLGGTGSAISKGSWMLETRAHCKLKVLPPVETTSYGPADFSALKEVVRRKLHESSL